MSQCPQTAAKAGPAVQVACDPVRGGSCGFAGSWSGISLPRLGMGLPCQDALGTVCLCPSLAKLSSQRRCSHLQSRARTSSRCRSQNSLLCVVAVTRAGTRCGREPTQRSLGTQSLCVSAILASFRCFKNSGKKQCKNRFGEGVTRAAVAHDGGEQKM